MLKNLILILFLLIGLSVEAAENYLNSIVLEKKDSDISIILRSDSVARLKREIEDSNKIVLILKGIKQSPDINTIYKNINNVSGLAIQNENGFLKIFIEAPDISKANIIFDTPNSAPITVNDRNNEGLFIWTIVSILMLLFIMRSAKNVTIEPEKKDINELIKEREKALYKNFQKEVASIHNTNYSLKSYRKHVLNGETIRSYANRMSLK